MFAFEKKFKKFREDEAGATTVEWVMLASLVTMVGLASTGVIERGFLALAGTVQGELRGDPVEQVAGLTYSDGFDHGSNGWSGASVTEINGVGNVLGPLGGTGGYPGITRDFDIDPDADQVQFEFDLLSLDSWDGESGIVFLNGYEVGRVTSDHRGSTTFTAAEGLANSGITIRGSVVDNNVDLGGVSTNAGFTDSRTTIQIAVDRPAEGDFDTISFGIGSTTDQGVNDESLALDNFTVRGLRDSSRSATAG
ncbi:hypothetical protein SAMN04488095_1163 [Jannaschia pohangensis]|uniref:Flp pilus assembly protein, pilin Flp n=2 Tax=Jannaschia pohangensis TaxID=390807 RepID=A0A1I3J059_9RHOB|nr:hypothetical protein SAMN04488095_1163 [Jannaschia pohangensis]